MKLTKYLCHVLTIKDMCYMMEFVHWLFFIKIVSQIVTRLKKIVIVKFILNCYSGFLFTALTGLSQPGDFF